jgi:hypothetical protein
MDRVQRRQLMENSSLRPLIGAVALAGISCAVAFATPGSAPPVCYVETWFDVTQSEEGNGATYANCPGRVLCAIGDVDKDVSPITFGPYPCEDFSGGTKVGGVCTGGTPIIPSVTTVVIDRQSCSGGCS